MLLLWDLDSGLTQIDKYMLSDNDNIKAGAFMAIGIVNSQVRDPNEPSMALLSGMYHAHIHALSLLVCVTVFVLSLSLSIPFVHSLTTSQIMCCTRRPSSAWGPSPGWAWHTPAVPTPTCEVCSVFTSRSPDPLRSAAPRA
jgi:hypothetical protein